MFIQFLQSRIRFLRKFLLPYFQGKPLGKKVLHFLEKSNIQMHTFVRHIFLFTININCDAIEHIKINVIS